MKTKDLIKKLQELDPSGNLHVRFSNEPLYFLIEKPGYWDGQYNYLEYDEEENPIWVQSIEGEKIDVYTMSMFDFVEHYQGDWEEIKKHIRIEFDDYVDKKQIENVFLNEMKKACDEYNEIVKEYLKNQKK